MTPFFKHDGIVLYHANVLEALRQLPSNSIHCCVTSPPYFALRSYLPKDHPLKDKEIGSEPQSEQFIATMVQVFREVRRVLRDDMADGEFNFLAVIKGDERYFFIYDDISRAETLRTFGRYASNPDLSFTWYDAAVLSQKIRNREEAMAKKQASIKTGDTVRLKYGGPIMLAKKVAGGKVWCRFYDTENRECEGEFAVENLVVVRSAEKKAVQGDGEKFRYFPIDPKRAEYRAGREAFFIGLSINQCPVVEHHGFSDAKLHWYAGYLDARTNERLWRCMPPGWDACNRITDRIY